MKSRPGLRASPMVKARLRFFDLYELLRFDVSFDCLSSDALRTLKNRGSGLSAVSPDMRRNKLSDIENRVLDRRLQSGHLRKICFLTYGFPCRLLEVTQPVEGQISHPPPFRHCRFSIA
ncbi:hypothetical protein Bcep18194_B3107 [Burkholderia lata]|uniref:Uncharacterized protein n=1 Tax=Burkholderia lata (strain ATCC 17760 / DSM 23089 / LMG 22485 / NCIMB 9086 / R18194 / 383) TaxID=482957 RepID=Q38ZZ9_BURL3|nr:hypothetical protein Bcep18194_B3107 [Burkholderia lata]